MKIRTTNYRFKPPLNEKATVSIVLAVPTVKQLLKDSKEFWLCIPDGHLKLSAPVITVKLSK